MNTRTARKPRTLRLSKVTVRRLDPAELAAAAGGAVPLITRVACAPKSNIWTAPGSCL